MMLVASDGANAWPNRKEQVKSLVRYYDFDVFDTHQFDAGHRTGPHDASRAA